MNRRNWIRSHEGRDEHDCSRFLARLAEQPSKLVLLYGNLGAPVLKLSRTAVPTDIQLDRKAREQTMTAILGFSPLTRPSLRCMVQRLILSLIASPSSRVSPRTWRRRHYRTRSIRTARHWDFPPPHHARITSE
jgi:hypothetical protein